jgi:ribosome biogenesis GTPase / thiamine phosphate phosphatase
MNKSSERLARLGFDEWFISDGDTVQPDDLNIARVTSVSKNKFTVSTGEQDISAELTGKFLFEVNSPLDLPAVGDWVYVRLLNDDTFAIITCVLPRRSLLKRKTSGSKIEYQLIAANIDTALIIQSLDSNYNISRLERYLVMINESNIQPVVLLSKSDLVSPDEIDKKKSEILKIIPGIDIVAFSSKSESGLNDVSRILTPAKTYCLLGSSGVGKSTLVNSLTGEELFRTQEVRVQDDRGKHTTTHRELVVLDSGAIIIDNPGMRELGVISVEAGLEETFNEIAELSVKCRYADCTHNIEKGCAVLSAVEEGTISKERYSNYIKMRKESFIS